MGKIILLIGPPGAGKSTWAELYNAKQGNISIVSRDKIRLALYGYTEDTVHEHFKHEEFLEREEETL